jgi:hypothetical protein
VYPGSSPDTNRSSEALEQAAILCEKAMKQQEKATTPAKLVSKSEYCRSAARDQDRRSPQRGDQAGYPRDYESVIGSTQRRRRAARAWSNVIPGSSAHDQDMEDRHKELEKSPPRRDSHHREEVEPRHRTTNALIFCRQGTAAILAQTAPVLAQTCSKHSC